MEAAARKLPRRLGRYEVVGRLATGGMAEILLGRLTGPSGFERPVVIKRILQHLAESPAFVDMFLDESRIAARIRHPNVVQVHELNREDGELFQVMEYLEGETAAGIARRARARRAKLDYALAAHVVAEAAAGLHAAHELRGPNGTPLDLVHRDISPQNIFVGYDGTVKVLDFGIAKAAGRVTKTETGILKGKFDYMSPEQSLGDPVDRRSDIFSLGIVLYELSAQRRLFRRRTQSATLRAITDDPVVPPSAVDPAFPAVLEAVCMRALARDPAERFATAQDMRRELLEALRELGASAMPEEGVSAQMHALFADRVAEKEEMLRRMREGLTPAHVPVADVDEMVELPSVEIELASELGGRHTGGTGRSRSTRSWALLVGAAALVGVGSGAYLLGATGEDSSAATGASPASGAPAGARGDSAPREVTLHVDSEPPGATVHVAGEARGVTPAAISVPRSDRPLLLRLELEGHEPAEETVTPDEPQRLRLSLSPRRGDTRRARRRRPALPAETAPPPDETTMDDPPPSADRDRSWRRFN